MTKILSSIGETVGNKIAEDMVDLFLGLVKDGYEEMIRKPSFQKKAGEGIKNEEIGKSLVSLTDSFSEDIKSDGIGYTMEELREKFNHLYDEYVGRGIEESYKEKIGESTKEELWKRFVIFSNSYLSKYNETLTYGENRILEITRDSKKMINELLESGQISKEKFEKIAEQQSELLRRLSDDIDVPYIDIDRTKSIKICEYEPKYLFFGNTFDFDENENRIDEYTYKSEISSYTLGLLIKNIGRTNIEKITIENLQMEYCKEIDDDNPELGYYVLPCVKHHSRCECKINVLPNAEEWLYLNFTNIADELNDENMVDNFMQDYYYDRLWISFDIILQSKKMEKRYKYILFLSKENDNKKDISGLYNVDYSLFIE